MKRSTKILLGLLILTLGGVGLYFYLDLRNYYSPGDSDTFKIGVGDSFTIKIGENGSTGYQNCWVNKDNCRSVKQTDEKHIGSWQKNCDGCGGTAVWTFQATTQGTDTIKIIECPTARVNRPCSFFADSSAMFYSDSIAYIDKPYQQTDYTFIVTVIE